MEDKLAATLLRAIEGYYHQNDDTISIGLDEFEPKGKEMASITFTLKQADKLINRLHATVMYLDGEWHVGLKSS